MEKTLETELVDFKNIGEVEFSSKYLSDFKFLLSNFDKKLKKEIESKIRPLFFNKSTFKNGSISDFEELINYVPLEDAKHFINNMESKEELVSLEGKRLKFLKTKIGLKLQKKDFEKYLAKNYYYYQKAIKICSDIENGKPVGKSERRMFPSVKKEYETVLENSKDYKIDVNSILNSLRENSEKKRLLEKEKTSSNRTNHLESSLEKPIDYQSEMNKLISEGNLGNVLYLCQRLKDKKVSVKIDTELLKRNFIKNPKSDGYFGLVGKSVKKLNEMGFNINFSKKDLEDMVKFAEKKNISLGDVMYEESFKEFGWKEILEDHLSVESFAYNYLKKASGNGISSAKDALERIEQKLPEITKKILKGKSIEDFCISENVFNPFVGHAGYFYDEKTKKRKDDLIRKYIVEKDPIKEYNVPKERIIDKIIPIKDANAKVIIYGFKGHNEPMKELRGKYILAKKGNELQLILDNTRALHHFIGEKYGVTPLGGGRFEINDKEKKWDLYGKSEDYGEDIKIISQVLLHKALPHYKVK